jgi:purine-binding chemotaxis protein CheW
MDETGCKYLTFSVDEEYYGIKIEFVREIIGIQQITHVPNQLEYIEGVINLRGKIIPTIDIRKRFGKELREYDDRTCIVVVNIDDLAVGVIVDRVVEVLNLKDDQISLPPQGHNDIKAKYTEGIGREDGKVIVLLDCEKIIRPEDFDGLLKSVD